jgi:hypothetical protein
LHAQPHATDSNGANWRPEIDSLAFQPHGHAGICVVHRRAIETLMGRTASPTECVAYFEAHQPAFAQAAAAKVVRASLGPAENFHLTSRDVARAQIA